MTKHGLRPRLSNGTRSTDTTVQPDERTAGPVFARFSRPRCVAPTTIAVVSDVHVSTEKRGTWKVFHRTRDRLRTVLTDADARGVDALVFAGDLTEDGAEEDFETVRALLADLDTPYFAVPGNHDVPKSFDEHDTPPLSSFEADFAPGGLPFCERVGGVNIVGLNSASTPDGTLADCHDGAISASQLAWLDDTLPETDAPLVVTHHNLPGLSAESGVHSWRSSFPTRNADEFADLLSRHDVPLHVSGHLHVPAIAETKGIREVVTPSLCSFPQAYLLFEVGPSGTTIRFVPAADPAGTREAYVHAKKDSARSNVVVETTLDRLSSLPLADEEPGSNAH